MKKIPSLIIALLLNTLVHAQNLQQVDWSTDIDFLANQLPKSHYNFFTVKDKKQFLAGLEKIKSGSAKSDLEVAIRLQQLVASFGDSHTRVDYGQFIDKRKMLPLHLYWFSDGLYIMHTTQENIEILGP